LSKKRQQQGYLPILLLILNIYLPICLSHRHLLPLGLSKPNSNPPRSIANGIQYLMLFNHNHGTMIALYFDTIRRKIRQFIRAEWNRLHPVKKHCRKRNRTWLLRQNPSIKKKISHFLLTSSIPT